MTKPGNFLEKYPFPAGNFLVPNFLFPVFLPGNVPLYSKVHMSHPFCVLQVEGVRLANGIPVNPNTLTSVSAYVQQDDLFIGTLTVREHLNFQVSLVL